MPDPFVFVQPGADGFARLAPDDEHHLRRVLRLREGGRLTASDGRGRTWPARLSREGTVDLAGATRMHPRPSPLLHVLHALPKGRKLEAVLQALVELGVDRITTVVADRSVVRLDAHRVERSARRWTAVARAAAAQARRAWLPEFQPATPVEVATAGAVLREIQAAGVVAHVGAPTPLGEALAALPPGLDAVAVAVGPEGGWTPAELRSWEAVGLQSVTLGSGVLRTEHAAFAACAAISFALGRMA
ncbi:MAG: 16S rRNA (uracil(1498)-N(3))-methyltransferase [Actinomycetota bacterium]|nr:16S rRNA (uracil(1498)-N(3))-methyltransferase [Actinomycetota bacterium]